MEASMAAAVTTTDATITTLSPLLKRCPVEIQLEILSYLQSPKDLLSALLSCRALCSLAKLTRDALVLRYILVLKPLPPLTPEEKGRGVVDAGERPTVLELHERIKGCVKGGGEVCRFRDVWIEADLRVEDARKLKADARVERVLRGTLKCSCGLCGLRNHRN